MREQVVHPESFLQDYIRADQQSDFLEGPGSEALCTVIEAWGARYSDLPVIFSIGGNRQVPKGAHEKLSDDAPPDRAQSSPMSAE